MGWIIVQSKPTPEFFKIIISSTTCSVRVDKCSVRVDLQWMQELPCLCHPQTQLPYHQVRSARISDPTRAILAILCLGHTNSSKRSGNDKSRRSSAGDRLMSIGSTPKVKVIKKYFYAHEKTFNRQHTYILIYYKFILQLNIVPDGGIRGLFSSHRL